VPIACLKTVRSYGCKYKCGHLHYKHPDPMAKHEKSCWLNPENKCCQTCEHEGIEYDDWQYRVCHHKEGEKLLDAEVEKSKNPRAWIKHCPFWTQKGVKNLNVGICR